MEINLKEICAINKCAASTEAIRYYLNGVYTHTDSDWVYFVATDGHKLVIYRTPNVDNVEWSFIIPRETLAGFKFSKRDVGMGDISYADGMINIKHNGSVVSVKPVDGDFPDYTITKPTGENEIAPAYFNAKYLVDFDNLSKALGLERALVSPVGDNPAMVTFGHRYDVYGIVMPMRHATFVAKALF